MTHKQISYVKSAVRIAGYFLLLAASLKGAVFVLVLSEVIGILEEVGE